MISEQRELFNKKFTVPKHLQFLQSLEATVGTKIAVRLCETPVFLPTSLLAEMRQAGQELILQLLTPEHLAVSSRAVPAEYLAANEGAHPGFVVVDFAICRNPDGRLAPRLIELQGAASLFAFQLILAREYQRVYDLSGFGYLLDGLTDESYLNLLRRVFLNGHSPEHVVLMEIDPLHQATLPDFKATEQFFGIRAVDVSDIVKCGDRLLYPRNGRLVEIRRLYNRVFIDELTRKSVRPGFDFRDELDVEWAGHPNWFFRISKFSLPFLNHRTVPRSWFVDQLEEYPSDLENFVLKPLFSFGGRGVNVGVTRDDLAAVPPAQRASYLLQERVRYAPVIKTPGEPSKVEVRVMFVWPDGDREPTAVTTLARLSRGAMMGVHANKSETWVGSSCCFWNSALSYGSPGDERSSVM